MIKRIDGTPYLMIELPKPMVLKTDGKGLWTAHEGITTIGKIGIAVYPDPEDEETEEWMSLDEGGTYIYMICIFNSREWNVDKHGLVYTDKRWIKQLNLQLRKIYPNFLGQFRWDYTEQGMQGSNYVSVESDLIKKPKVIKNLFAKLRQIRFNAVLDRLNTKKGKALKRIAGSK